jgi:hypothetical protein
MSRPPERWTTWPVLISFDWRALAPSRKRLVEPPGASFTRPPALLTVVPPQTARPRLVMGPAPLVVPPERNSPLPPARFAVSEPSTRTAVAFSSSSPAPEALTAPSIRCIEAPRSRTAPRSATPIVPPVKCEPPEMPRLLPAPLAERVPPALMNRASMKDSPAPVTSPVFSNRPVTVLVRAALDAAKAPSLMKSALSRRTEK